MHKLALLMTAVVTLLSSLSSHAQSSTEGAAEGANKSPPRYNLLLAGGNLRICSTMQSNNCDDTRWIDRNTMRIERYLSLSERNMKALLDDSLWPAHRRTMRDQVREALTIIKQRVNQDVMSEYTFMDEFGRRATAYVYDNLSDQEMRLIVDHLEMPTPTDRQEVVDLNMNIDLASRELVRGLVLQARSLTAEGQRPKVLVVTAAARDSLGAADFYTRLLESAGADVTWLPIDAAVNSAQLTQRCAALADIRVELLATWQRAKVHPARHQQQLDYCQNLTAGAELLRDAHGVFFADGSAHLLRQAMLTPLGQPTALTEAMYRRLQNQSLVVAAMGGASAALTARAMLSGGSSEMAMKEGARAADPAGGACDLDDSCPLGLNQDSLTYHPLGGLGWFSPAIIDTEFTEKGRHGRLLRLAATTSTPLALGIDEKTGLMVNTRTGAFEVIGRGGVFFSVAPVQNDSAVASTFHYVMAGSSGRFGDGDIADVQLATAGRVVTEAPTTRFLSDRGLADSLRLLCNERDSVTALDGQFRLTLLGDDSTTRQIAGGECQVMNARMGIAWEPQKNL
ncbi:cyanophycinase [Pseudidiomarina mangrovi]|uniref:cyanophycinase n=1 Tax=Pseudidiomarina mangrovi TaxID=2487133 RepID=UPI000FCA4F45|nr:cyanophycinase [Pseudidiomarina mangrovi]